MKPAAEDARHHLHPFTDPRALVESGARVFVRGEGIHVTDADGHRYLDALAGLWCVQVGYGRPELAAAAEKQIRKLSYYSTFVHSTTEPTAQLAAELASLTPQGLDLFFFANSGSEVVDSAVRFCRLYWQLAEQPEKSVIIGRHLGYHGSTLAAASVGGMPRMHAQGGLPLPGFEHVMAPHHYLNGNGLSPEEFGLAAARSLELKIEELGADRVAAFFGEPVMGAGGVIVPPENYWPEIQRICRKHDVLLVADEVICGFGRTGAWWGSQTFSIQPDLMTMAKGLTSGYVPMSALALGPRVAELITEKAGQLAHGFTYSGHPVAAAVALANLKILREEELVERVAKDTGPYLQRCLREAFADHPLVGEVRGVGLIAALEIVRDRDKKEHFPAEAQLGARLTERLLANELIARVIGNALAVSPPLIVTRADIDVIIERMRRSLDELEAS
jgi:putrescine aminotransferase